MNKILDFKIKLNYLKYFRRFKKKINQSLINVKDFETVFFNNRDETIILHVGFSSIQRLFLKDSYNKLIKILKKYYKNIIVPGFTPSFRNSEIYHKKFSLPEYGYFSKLFFKNEQFIRTNDCIHNFLILGNYNFNGCTFTDSFGKNSIFEKFNENNITYVNIGTYYLTSSQLHYIENNLNVPYINQKKFEGIIYYDEEKYEKIIQKNFKYKFRLEWNRTKIEKHLLKDGIIKKYNLNGLPIRFFKSNDLYRALEDKISKNPYYLII